MTDIQKDLLREYAAKAARDVTSKTIRAMQRITDTLSAEDSGLANAWDELCVQAQGEDSCFREAYDETLYAIVSQNVGELSQNDLQTIWLQTDRGWNWHWEIENPPESKAEDQMKSRQITQGIPYDTDEIVSYIINTFVLPKAESYSNRRIESFLEQYE